MRAVIHPRLFGGTIRAPASKSHTVRRLLLASLTNGVSEIHHPLDSLDTQSCVSVCRALGAEITEQRDEGKLIKWIVNGRGPVSQPNRCNVGNSGTTLYLALAAAALGSETVEFDGDDQIRRRSAAPLLQALTGLGIKVSSAANGCAPISVKGPWKGGRVSLNCPTSQYLSAILLAAPLAPPGVVTEIDIPLLNEKPYVEITLSYLKAQNIDFEAAADFSYFRIPGGAAYKPIKGPVPGDFSSAAFPASAAAITGGSLTLLGLDPHDSQGDKDFFSMLQNMGCIITWDRITQNEGDIVQSSCAAQPNDWALKVSREGPLKAGVFDLNAVPDLLPVMAVMASYAEGETTLLNVAHARIKETDRIAVMAKELGKLGIICKERPDGLVINGMAQTGPRAAPSGVIELDGHGDHRIVMALAACALGLKEGTAIEISGAESADITYPGFLKLLQK